MPEESERIPFNMDCQRCEYEPICFVPLKVAHKLTRKWYQLCKQGRKRKVIRQSTIAEVLERFEQKKQARIPDPTFEEMERERQAGDSG